MGQTPGLISKKLSEEPIKVPQNPFWQVFKRFGTDEALAGIINIVATATVGFFSSSAVFLSLAGPVLEKLGFFPANFIEARKVYKTTPKSQRKPILYYFKSALRNSGKSLAEDILIHDPIYVGLMFFGLKIYSSVPPWLLASASFVIAVVIVAFLEVAYTELKYLNFKNKLKRSGFNNESYYETRFFIKSNNPKKDLKKISLAFDLSETGSMKYHDRYFLNNLEEYSGRIARVRLRIRDNPFKGGFVKTLQIVYTRARESSREKFDQYRFFPIRKEKLYSVIEGPMPKTIKEVENVKARRILKYSQKVYPKEIKFFRNFARNDELLVTLDKCKKGEKYHIFEVKVRKDVKLLIEVMRYIMREFPVVQTTKGKFELEF